MLPSARHLVHTRSDMYITNGAALLDEAFLHVYVPYKIFTDLHIIGTWVGTRVGTYSSRRNVEGYLPTSDSGGKKKMQQIPVPVSRTHGGLLDGMKEQKAKSRHTCVRIIPPINSSTGPRIMHTYRPSIQRSRAPENFLPKTAHCSPAIE